MLGCAFISRGPEGVCSPLCVFYVLYFSIYIHCIQVNVKHAKGTCNVMCVTLQYFKLQLLEHQCSFDCYTLYCSCIYYNCMSPWEELYWYNPTVTQGFSLPLLIDLQNFSMGSDYFIKSYLTYATAADHRLVCVVHPQGLCMTHWRNFEFWACSCFCY